MANVAPAPAASPAAAPAAEEPVVITGGSDFKTRVARFERELLQRALADHRFNQRATAEALGLTYDQLRHALKRHELLGRGAERTIDAFDRSASKIVAALPAAMR